MSNWVINHSWESFRRTREYCGFISEAERNKIKLGDKIVYYGNKMVFGLFEAIALPENEFRGWQKPYPYQVKLKQIALPKNELIAKLLESKILLQKLNGGSTNLVELTEIEFNEISKAIEQGQKELNFS